MDSHLKFMVKKPSFIVVIYLYPFDQHKIYNHLMLTECKFPPSITDRSLFANDLLSKSSTNKLNNPQYWEKKHLSLFTNISQQGISILSNALSQIICSDTLRCFQIIKTEQYDFHTRFSAFVLKMSTEVSTKTRCIS